MRETTFLSPERRSQLRSQLRRAVRASVRPVIAVVAAGTFMAILGPFSTNAIGWPMVWVYWTTLMAVGGGGGLFAARVTARHAARLPELLRWVTIAAAAAVPVTLAALGFQWGTNTQLIPPAAWPLLYVYVLVVSAGVSGVMFLISRVRDGARPPQAGAPGTSGASGGSAARAPFLDRLPPKLKGARIFAVQAEDHYLRVHTSAGDDLILLRLADAERELESLDGLRVHRSWWVARDAVADVTRADGRMILKLVNGVEAPVSRTYARAVRDAGWT